MKLSKWAKLNGLTYMTAYTLFKKNQLPVKSQQLESGTILVEYDETPVQSTNTLAFKNIIYSRVSGSDQKNDLERQSQRLKDYCSKNGVIIHEEYKEIASGLNTKRKYFNKIITDPEIKNIYVENSDRLVRFGFETIEILLKVQNKNIIVINKTENITDLNKDLVDIITCYCAKIYGSRANKNKIKKIQEVINETS